MKLCLRWWISFYSETTILNRALNPARVLCPAGWRVPSDADWTILTNYLGGLHVGSKMQLNTDLWSPVGGVLFATNQSEFSALPAGKRLSDGNFGFLRLQTYWWTSTQVSTAYWHRNIDADFSGVFKAGSSKSEGLSVRCIKN